MKEEAEEEEKKMRRKRNVSLVFSLSQAI